MEGETVMKTKTKIVSILLLIVMVVSIFPITAFADGFTPVDAVSAAGGSGVTPGSAKPGGNDGVWSSRFQGFRIAILGFDGTPAFTFMGKDYIDLLFSKDNLSAMDYFGDGVKTEMYRGIYDSPNKLKSYIFTIDDIRKALDTGVLSTAVPNTGELNKAIAKFSSTNIPKPLGTVGTGASLKWVTYGDAIKNVFYGDGDTLDETALIYVVLNLATVKPDKTIDWLWQPKSGAYTGENTFTTEELSALNDGDITPIQLMASKRLVVSIEPIIWNKLRLSSTQYSYGVYGTQTAIGGIIYWLEEGGWFKPTSGQGTGGYDTSLFGRVGRRSMITANTSLVFPAYRDKNGDLVLSYRWKIEPPKDIGQRITNYEVYQLQPGWSLHLYMLNGKLDIDIPEDKPTPTSTTPALTESELTKVFNSVDNWGPVSFTFTCTSMSDHHSHYVGDDSDGDPIYESCSARVRDGGFNYIIKNTQPLDGLIEAKGTGGSFQAQMVDNSHSGSYGISGGGYTLGDVGYKTVIWRGIDIPTAASYKMNSTDEIVKLLNSQGSHYGKTPAGTRKSNGTYKYNLSVLFDKDPTGDYRTSTEHEVGGSLWSNFDHTMTPAISKLAEITIGVYRGVAGNKSIGNETTSELIKTTTKFGNAVSSHSTGYMVKGPSTISFYPYIRMTYQYTNDTVKRDAYVLSEQLSQIMPNDFAEAAWYNSNESTSLNITSNQWSLHAKAVNGTDGWQGKNQVLPGGAMYSLDTGTAPSKVSIITWQTIVADPQRSALASAIGANDYTLASAEGAHTDYVNNAKTVLEGLRVVQWVNGDFKATNAWTNNGKSVMVSGPNTSLTSLGLSVKSSYDAKYQVSPDGSNTSEKVNDGDLDIIADNKSQNMYFKVFSDPAGDIYLAYTTVGVSALAGVSGTQIASTSNVEVSKILTKDIPYDKVEIMLGNGYAYEIDKRTKLITNFVKSIERNTGKDNNASWVNDGKWYNEAWDGIILVRQANTLTVGFSKPGIRTAVSDPTLAPVNTGMGDLFTKAFLSQFRVASKSDASIAASKPDHYIGTFKGTDIFLKDMESMYQSKKFYLPNVNVQDLD